MLMYYKALGTLRTNSNMAVESLAIFTENVSSLDKSIKTVETNAKNQEVIKNALRISVQLLKKHPKILQQLRISIIRQ